MSRQQAFLTAYLSRGNLYRHSEGRATDTARAENDGRAWPTTTDQPNLTLADLGGLTMDGRYGIVMFVTVAMSLGVVSQAGNYNASDNETTRLENELRAVEVAFAQTMAERNLRAFSEYLSHEAVFFNGEDALRGPQPIVDAWAHFFEGQEAPFSWKPEVVAVLESGTLGFTSGPVLDPEGTRIGTFNSVWRRLQNGNWQIVFDRGCP